jgi:OOP family OmpA-OmpF porin
MHIFKTTIIVACSIFWAATAAAAGGGGYIGGAFGSTNFEDDGRYFDLGAQLDDQSNGAQIFGGFNFNHFFGIEGTIANLGEFEDTTGTLIDSFEVVAVTAIFRTPTVHSPVSFFGKVGLGVIYWEEEDLLYPWMNDEDSGGALALGFGVTFTPRTESYLSFRIAFDLYSFVFEEVYLGTTYEYDQSIGMSSIGMQFNF